MMRHGLEFSHLRVDQWRAMRRLILIVALVLASGQPVEAQIESDSTATDPYGLIAQAFAPQVVDTPPLQFEGQRFEPQVVDTPPLQFEGQRFAPQVVDTPPLQFEGQRFAPQVVDTPSLQFEGQRFERQVLDTPPLQFEGQHVALQLLAGLAVAPDALVGGQSAQGVVRLDGPAPVGGLVIALASDNPAARVPVQLAVAPGVAEAIFAIATDAVPAKIDVTITASLGDTVASAFLTVNPAGLPADGEFVFEVVGVALLSVRKSGGQGDEVLPFDVDDVEEDIGGAPAEDQVAAPVVVGVCTTPVTVPAAGFASDVALHIDAVTGACELNTAIGAATEAVRFSKQGISGIKIEGFMGWGPAPTLLFGPGPHNFDAILGGVTFSITFEVDIDFGTTEIQVTVTQVTKL